MRSFRQLFHLEYHLTVLNECKPLSVVVLFRSTPTSKTNNILALQVHDYRWVDNNNMGYNGDKFEYLGFGPGEKEEEEEWQYTDPIGGRVAVH